MDSGLISMDEAAAEFKVHRTTLFRAIREGVLQRHRLVGDRRTYLSRPDVQRAVDPPSVTRSLQLVYEKFTHTAEWPLATEIQREIDRQPDFFDFLAAVESLPQDLGWRVRDLEGHVHLTIRGVARCDGSAGDVNAFLTVVRECYDRYLSSDEKPEITSEELSAKYGWGSLLLQKLYRLVQIESGFWSGLGQIGHSWTLTVDVERIRHFRNVDSLGDYFAAKERLFKPSEVRSMVPVNAWSPNPITRLKSTPAVAGAPKRQSQSSRASERAPDVLQAAIAFEKALRSRVPGTKLYGPNLINAFFDRAQEGAPPDPRRIEAIRSLSIAAMSAYRNPVAHGRMTFTKREAADVSAMFALLSREVAAIKLPPSAPTNPAKSTVN